MLNRFLVALLPLVPKRIVKRFAARYVAGETHVDMIHAVKALNNTGFLATVDFLGEFIRHPHEAQATARMVTHIINEIHSYRLDANVSVKLTSLGLLLDPALCFSLMQQLVEHAAQKGVFIRIDMEDSHCTQATIDLYLKFRHTHRNVGIVLQAYLHRTLADAGRIIQAGAGHFRLCKGIYVEPSTIAYQTYDEINHNYLNTLEKMLSQGAYVGIATHDPVIVERALELIKKYNLSREQYEFQMLLGVSPQLRQTLLDAGHRVRVYVPFGQQWYAYCMRRLKENPKIAGYIFKNLISR